MLDSDELRRLSTETETADDLNLSRSTLRRQKMKHRPASDMSLIPSVRLGRDVRYDVRELDEPIESLRMIDR